MWDCNERWGWEVKFEMLSNAATEFKYTLNREEKRKLDQTLETQ